MATATASSRAPKLPKTERYQFEAPIGAGGVGTVYRAYDRRLERPVPELADQPDGEQQAEPAQAGPEHHGPQLPKSPHSPQG